MRLSTGGKNIVEILPKASFSSCAPPPIAVFGSGHTGKLNELVEAVIHIRVCKSDSQAVFSRMQLDLYATRPTPHGASQILVQATPVWSVKTRRAPSRHCRDATVYGHTTAAMDVTSTPPPHLLYPCAPSVAANLRLLLGGDCYFCISLCASSVSYILVVLLPHSRRP